MIFMTFPDIYYILDIIIIIINIIIVSSVNSNCHRRLYFGIGDSKKNSLSLLICKNMCT